MEPITPAARQRGIAQTAEHRLCFPRRAFGLFGVHQEVNSALISDVIQQAIFQRCLEPE